MNLSSAYGGEGAGFQRFTQLDNNPGTYADAAARDVYFGANPSELARLDANEFLIIKLLDDGGGNIAYQQRDSSIWVDVTSLVQGDTGPAGPTGNSYFFSSIIERDAFFDTPPNEGLLKNGLPVTVNVGDDTTSTFIWGGSDAPTSYDNTLWRLGALEVSSGTLYLGESGANISSGSEVINFISASSVDHYLHGISYDDTGSNPPAFWKLPAISQIPLADVSDTTLTDPQTLSTTNTLNLAVKEYTLIPAASGEMRVQTWLGTDETGPSLVDTFITVAIGDIGNPTVFQAPNNTFVLVGQNTYTKFSGVQLKGGVQTLPPFVGQTVPFVTLGAWSAAQYLFVTLKDSASIENGITFFDNEDGEATSSPDFTYNSATKEVKIYKDNSDTTVAGLTIEQDGTGDALQHFVLTGTKTWSVGVANNNEDRFKITHGNDLSNDESLLLDPLTGMYLVHSNADTGSTEFNGITMKNTSGGDDTYTSIQNVGDGSIIASYIKFNNDDFSADYGSIYFGARDSGGFEPNAMHITAGGVAISGNLTVEGSIYPNVDVYGYMKNGTAGFAEGHISTGEFIGTTIPLTATGIIYSVYWGKDGLRLFVTTEDEYIYQYDLTIPYDITSATYAGSNNFTLVSNTAAFQLWNNDGTILWHGGRQATKVSFTNPWEISSISGDVIESNVSFRNPFHLWDLRWKSDGTKYYGVGFNLDAPFANLSVFVEWEVVTPFNLSTKTTIDALNAYAFPTGIPSIATGQLGFDIRPDGKRCYVFMPSTGIEYEIVLATAWDFSDTTLVNTVTRTQHTDTTNFAMSPDATTITGITPAGLIVQKKLGLETNSLVVNEGIECSVIDTPLVYSDTDLRLRTNSGDVIIQIDTSTERVEILGLTHNDDNVVMNIATVDGDVDIYVGEDTPVGNVSATGGSFYFRDAELDAGLYIKRSTGAASTSGWVSVGDVSGPGSSIVNSIPVFDVTDGSSITGFDNAKLVESGIITKLDIEAPASPGTAGVSFCDSSSVEQGSIGWADATPDVFFIISPNSDISYTSGGGVHAFKSGNSSFNFLRVRSPGVTASAGIIIEDSGAGGPLSILYHESTTASVIQDNSSTGLNIETGNRIKFQTASSHTIPLLLLEATGAGGADIAVHVGDENPEGTITSTPGGLYARANGVNSSLNIHKAAGSGNTGWERAATFTVEEGMKFVPSAAPTYAQGQVYYDSTDDSLSYQTGSSGVTNNIGKEIFVPPKIYNDQGVAITNGQAVYVSGSTGTYPEVKLAQANADATAHSVGLITEPSIANGETGYCTTYGLVRGFNTVSWATGDILYLSPTVAGGLQNTKPVYPNLAIRMGIVISSAADGTIWVTYPTEEITTGSAQVYKSHAISDQGAQDIVYLAGDYSAPTTSVTLTIGGTTTQTYGTILGAYAKHAFCVASGAGGTDLVLTVTGISINDAGVKNDSDSEILVADTDAATTDQYFETTKKWLGTVTYTLSGAAGAFTFNYGYCKYDDYGNQPFTVTDFEMHFKSGVSATGQNIELLHHRGISWTYAVTGFVPGPSDTIISMSDDYGVNTSIFTDEYFPYKRSGLTTSVDGSASEGIIVRVTQSTNNSTDFGTAHIGVRV